jgi:hypothetical protein
MKVGRTPESIAADLTVPERILLFCIDSGTDWQKTSRVTGAAVNRDGARPAGGRGDHRGPPWRLHALAAEIVDLHADLVRAGRKHLIGAAKLPLVSSRALSRHALPN